VQFWIRMASKTTATGIAEAVDPENPEIIDE
jgi:hypothetical protein